MKKKLYIAVLIGSLLVSLCACGGTTKQADAGKHTETAVNVPDLSQIRSICELATLECFYHNVAKSTKTKGSGLLHIGEKQRIFWIEYTGTAKIGIDMAALKMSVDGQNVTVTIPPAKLLSCEVAQINEEGYILSTDGVMNKNKITADEQTKAVAQAQEDMAASVKKNTALLASAQERAKKLIANYIEQIGSATGVAYTLTWEYAP